MKNDDLTIPWKPAGILLIIVAAILLTGFAVSNYRQEGREQELKRIAESVPALIERKDLYPKLVIPRQRITEKNCGDLKLSQEEGFSPILKKGNKNLGKVFVFRRINQDWACAFSGRYSYSIYLNNTQRIQLRELDPGQKKSLYIPVRGVTYYGYGSFYENDSISVGIIPLGKKFKHNWFLGLAVQ